MPRTVHIPEVGTVAFPDSMDDAAITAAIENDILKPVTIPGTEKTGLPGVPLIQPRVQEQAKLGAADLIPSAISIPAFTVGKAAASAGLGIGAMLEPLGSSMELDAKAQGKSGFVGRGVKDLGELVRGWKAEVDKTTIEPLREYEGKSFSTHPELWRDPKYITSTVGQAVGSLAAFLVPGKAAGKLGEEAITALAPKLVQARPLLGKAAQTIAGSAAGSALESAVNATDNYVAAKTEYNASEEVALAVFEKTLRKDLPVTAVTNLLGLYSPKVGPLWAQMLHRVGDAALEGYQEVKQGDVAHEALREQFGDAVPGRAGQAEEFLGGAGSGALLSLLGVRPRGAQARQVEGDIAAEPTIDQIQADAAAIDTGGAKVGTQAAADAVAERKLREAGVALPEARTTEPGGPVRSVRKVADLAGEARAWLAERNNEAPISRGELVEAIGANHLQAAGVLGQLEREGVLKKRAEGKRTVWEPVRTAPERGKDLAALAGAVDETNATPAEVVQTAPETFQQDRETVDQADEIKAESSPRTPSVEPAYGRETSIAIPGEQTKYPARYAVREADDVIPSHNPLSFEKEPGYEHQNDRDYKQPGNAARVVDNSSPERFDPEFLLTDSPTAEQGATIIDPRGNALGGNNRRMTLGRVYEYNAEGAAKYKAELVKRAAQFGVDPAAVEKMQRPVLVRERTEAPADAQREITDYNKTAAAKLNPGEQAVTDGRRLSDKSVERIVAKLEDAGEGGSLADALRGDAGAEIVQGLVADGLITEQEKNAYIDERESLTAEGKARIAKALAGRMFTSADQWNRTPPEMRNKLERVAPHVARVEGRAEWKLTDAVREALDLIEDARTHKTKNLDDVAAQTGLTGETRGYSAQAVAIAKLLQQSPVRAAQAFRRYANDEALSREGAQGSFFTPPTQEEAFEDAFGEREYVPQLRPFNEHPPTKTPLDVAVHAQGIYRPSKSGGHGTVYLNRPAAELTEALLAEWAGDKPTQVWQGLTLPPVLSKVAETQLAIAAERLGKINPEIARGVRSVADAIAEARKQHSVVVLAQAGPGRTLKQTKRLLRHERTHAAQLTFKPDQSSIRGHVDANRFFQSPAATKAGKTLLDRYPAEMDVVAAEVPAWIAGGQWTELGLNRREAAGVLRQYFQLLGEQHGMKALDAIRNVHPQVRRQLHGAVVRGYRKAAGTSGVGRQADGRHGDIGSGPGQNPSGRSIEGPALRSSAARESGAASEGVRRGAVRRGVREDVPGKTERGVSGVYLGSGLGGLQAWFDRNPNKLDLANPRNLVRRLSASKLADAVSLMLPLETRVAREGGGVGKVLMDTLRRAGDWGEVSAGKRLVRLSDAHLDKLTREQRFELLDVLEGRGKPKSAAVRDAATVARQLLDEIGGEAEALDVMVQRGDGKRVPFEKQANYFPHLIRGDKALRSGKVRADVLVNMVRIGAAKDEADATKMLDGYLGFVESGARSQRLIDHLIETNQAKDEGEATKLLLRARERALTKKHGNLEFAREVNLPFYDPDPLRVLPQHVAAASMRLAQVAELGQGDAVVYRQIKAISDAGGNPAFVEAAMKKILHRDMEADTAAKRVARFLMDVQVLKLGLAAVPNVFQNLNTVVKTKSLRVLAAGWRGALTSEGRRFAAESGATMETILHEQVRDLMGDSRKLDAWLRWNGLAPTDRFGRAFAANAGAEYARRMLTRLRMKPLDKKARAALSELGIEAEEVRKRGKLSGDELLIAAKRMSDLTQFRSRPQDLPEFASATWGKVFFQFKNFAYNQGRFIWRETVGEIKAGRAGEGLLAMALIGTLFPLSGEVVRAIKGALQGKEPEEFESLWMRYWADLVAVGTLGLFSDVLQAGKSDSPAKRLAGPAVGWMDDTVRLLHKFGTGEGEAKDLKRYLYRHGPMGSVVKGVAEP